MKNKDEYLVAIIREKCVKDQEGNMEFDDNTKVKTWRTLFLNLLNVEIP